MSPNNGKHQEELAADQAAKPRARWHGGRPSRCEKCSIELTAQFVDGATIFGSWAIMCTVCHSLIGVGLGVGRGQLYNLKTMEKVGG